MKSGYDKFFKEAKNSKQPKARVQTKKSRRQEEETAEEYLRKALNMKNEKIKTKTSKFPAKPLLVILIALSAGFLAYERPDQIKSWIERLEITFLSSSLAQDTGAPSENLAETKRGTGAESADSTKAAAEKNCTEIKGFTDEELSHFNKLSDRKNELDQREQELSVLEEELHKQKAEIEVRMVKLEQIREEVATVLKERVEIDQQRVGTLVDFYSNMKPKQAAEIFAKLNENLAVEVLGKMKKKNAADILNLLEPTKARTLSEKFTGYTRR